MDLKGKCANHMSDLAFVRSTLVASGRDCRLPEANAIADTRDMPSRRLAGRKLPNPAGFSALSAEMRELAVRPTNDVLAFYETARSPAREADARASIRQSTIDRFGEYDTPLRCEVHRVAAHVAGPTATPARSSPARGSARVRMDAGASPHLRWAASAPHSGARARVELATRGELRPSGLLETEYHPVYARRLDAHFSASRAALRGEGIGMLNAPELSGPWDH